MPTPTTQNGGDAGLPDGAAGTTRAFPADLPPSQFADFSFEVCPDATVAAPAPAAFGAAVPDAELVSRFAELVASPEVDWRIHYRLIRQIGSGGQGRVFLADRLGSYQTQFRLALKFFDPARYAGAAAYHADMARMSRVAVELARLQNDTLLDVYNVIEMSGVQVLAMEWVDGYDLRQLLNLKLFEQTRANVPDSRFEYLNDVVVTTGGTGPAAPETPRVRFQPGVAVAIARECLTGLGALHRAGIVHADVKPANIMVKRSGSSKMIDVGAAFLTSEPPQRRAWTPRYAAVEVCEGQPPGPESDLASLGYTLVELLTGFLPFDDATTPAKMVRAKRELSESLSELLPPDSADDDSLVNFIQRLIHPDPAERFGSAESADFDADGATAFLRRLVKGDLDSEYRNELRVWLGELDGAAKH